MTSQILIYDTLKIKVVALGKLNTKYAEYSPFIFNKELYFISDREDNLALRKEEKGSAKLITSLYKSKIIDSLFFKMPQKETKEVKTNFFVGPFCETPNGYYYTTNSNVNKGTVRKMPLQINYIDKKNLNNKSTELKIAFGLNDTISCAHPAVVNDTLMFFASDLQDNSQGKIDLFYSIKKNNEWQKPINCGAKINSAYNESFPYYVNSVLYFSSDRPNGFGGLDIYKIDWSIIDGELILLSNPINSKADDFGVFIDSNLTSGYFSSNRSGNDDIFYFRNIVPEYKNCVQMKNNNYCYTFYEETGLDTKDTAGMAYEWSFGDSTKIRGLQATHCFEKEGKYLVKLNVVDKSSGEVFYNQVEYVFDLYNERQLFIYSPDSIKTGTELVFDPTTYTNINELFILKYYWDFGDRQSSFQEKPKHVYNKEGDYTVTLGVEAILSSQKTKLCVTKKITVRDNITHPVYYFNIPK